MLIGCFIAVFVSSVAVVFVATGIDELLWVAMKERGYRTGLDNHLPWYL